MAKSTSKLFQSEEPVEMKEDALNLPEEKDEETKAEEEVEQFLEKKLEKNEAALATLTQTHEEIPVEDEIVDIDLSATKRKKFRINGDNSKIIALNISDLNIMSRVSVAYERLTKQMEKVANILDDTTINEDDVDENYEIVTKTLDEIDANMRQEIDFIFDAPVSEACADGGSMYDPFEGSFRYEHIIEALLKLYERNLDSEFNKMKKKISMKTSKYTKKYHN